MIPFLCDSCGSNEYVVKTFRVGGEISRVGLYCKHCDKFQKWLPKRLWNYYLNDEKKLEDLPKYMYDYKAPKRIPGFIEVTGEHLKEPILIATDCIATVGVAKTNFEPEVFCFIKLKSTIEYQVTESYEEVKEKIRQSQFPMILNTKPEVTE